MFQTTESSTFIRLYASLPAKMSAAGRNHVHTDPCWTMHPSYQDIVFADGLPEELNRWCIEWAGHMSAADLEQTRCHLANTGQDAQPDQLMRSQSLREVIAWLEARWLSRLIDAERFVTYFQPIVHLGGRPEIMAYECLMRGQSEDGEIIPPFPLLRAARAIGCLESLDVKAQKCALRTAASLGLETSIFINCLPQNLTNRSSLVETVLATAREHDIDPSRLVFEIVETDQIEDCRALQNVVDLCHREKSQIALDDVGTGYNSLHLMTELRPDFIKLDRDLVANVHRDLFKSRVAAKLIELAHDLDIQTIVEGIETEGEWRWATDQGAELGQGFYIGRPAPRPEHPFASCT
jgi:EAL domain-containing protein (putative c-di-GMP-specific phosphodiesterase class I)